MTRNELLLNIEELISNLNEQQRRLQAFSGEIPAIETDLLQRQIRQLYELALQLEKVTHIEPSISPPLPLEDQPVGNKHESPSEKITIEAGLAKESMDPAIITSGIKVQRIKGDVNTVLFKSEPTLGDRFENEPSLHKKITSSHKTDSFASQMQQQPIGDLTKAIGLNEKFLFINHLFDGNLQVYNQAIDYLNTSKTKDVALEYIQNTLRPQFGWEMESKPCRLFFEIIERRF